MSLSRRIILILSLIIFISCAVYIGKYCYDRYTARENISRIQHLVESADSNRQQTSPDKGGENSEQDGFQGDEYIEQYAENGMLLGYYEAYKQNNDMVGWIKINDTKLNYPVMYRSDSNDYYLHRNFDKEYEYSGLPFLDTQCSLSPQSSNLIIYAHNMKDGSMFAVLTDYESKSYYEQHKIINFDTNYERGEYAVIAVFSTKIGSEDEFRYNECINMNDSEFLDYVNTAKALSFYETGQSAVPGDKLLTLSTCSYNRSNERTVVVAKKI